MNLLSGLSEIINLQFEEVTLEIDNSHAKRTLHQA